MRSRAREEVLLRFSDRDGRLRAAHGVDLEGAVDSRSGILRLSPWSGIFVGAMYVTCPHMMQGSLFAWTGAGIFLPLLLLLVECYFRGYRRTALLFWPWAVAFCFFSGHFEGAFRINLVAVLY